MRGQAYDPEKTTTSAITGGLIGYMVYPAVALLFYWLGASNSN